MNQPLTESQGPPHRWAPRLRRALAFLALDCVVGLLAWSWPVLADTSSALNRAPAAVCYCSCAEAHARGGCAKLCEIKKYATRWWATSCAKPHQHTPTNNAGSGPRLPHPDHPEHAQL